MFAGEIGSQLFSPHVYRFNKSVPCEQPPQPLTPSSAQDGQDQASISPAAKRSLAESKGK